MAEVRTYDLELGATPQGYPDTEADHRHELQDANPGHVALFAGIMIALAVCMHLTLAGMLALFRRTPEQVNAELPPIRSMPVPPPRLWSFQEPDHLTPQQNYDDLNRQEDRLLRTYGWTDPSHATVRLPIERAKELLLASPDPAAPVRQTGKATAPENQVRLSTPQTRP